MQVNVCSISEKSTKEKTANMEVFKMVCPWRFVTDACQNEIHMNTRSMIGRLNERCGDTRATCPRHLVSRFALPCPKNATCSSNVKNFLYPRWKNI